MRPDDYQKAATERLKEDARRGGLQGPPAERRGLGEDDDAATIAEAHPRRNQLPPESLALLWRSASLPPGYDAVPIPPGWTPAARYLRARGWAMLYPSARGRWRNPPQQFLHATTMGRELIGAEEFAPRARARYG